MVTRRESAAGRFTSLEVYLTDKCIFMWLNLFIYFACLWWGVTRGPAGYSIYANQKEQRDHCCLKYSGGCFLLDSTQLKGFQKNGCVRYKTERRVHHMLLFQYYTAEGIPFSSSPQEICHNAWSINHLLERTTLQKNTSHRRLVWSRWHSLRQFMLRKYRVI